MSVKKISTSDKVSRPFEVSKHWSFDSRVVEDSILRENEGTVDVEYDDDECDIFLGLESQYPFNRIKVSHGLKIEGVFFDTSSIHYDPATNPLNNNGTYKRSIYDFVNKTFYDDSYGIFNLSGVETIDRKANGTFVEERSIGDEVVLLEVSPSEFGEKIIPNSVSITGYKEGRQVFKMSDDGNTNLRYETFELPTSTLQPSHNDFVEGYQPINDRFGQYIKSFGDYVMVGMPSDVKSFNEPKAGMVQLFKMDSETSTYRFIKEFYVPENQNAVAEELSLDNEHLIGLEQGGFVLTGNEPSPYTSIHDNFGTALDISDQFAVIGAPGDSAYEESGLAPEGDYNEGVVFIYDKYKGGIDNWGLITVLQGNTGDGFGTSVSIQGDTVVIGAPGVSGSSGAVYIYRRKIFMDDDACLGIVTSSFYQLLEPEWDYDTDYYTSSFAANFDDQQGLYDVYDLYEEQDTPYFIAGNNTFVLEQVLTPSNVTDTEFGISVGVYNGDIVVGTGNDSIYVYSKYFESGSHYYLNRDGESLYLRPDGGSLYLQSGAVEICEPGYWDQSCRFGRSVTNIETPNVTTYNIPSGYGSAVSITKDFIAVGVPQDTTFKQYASASNSFDMGSVYIYQRDLSGCETDECDFGCNVDTECDWKFTQRLTPDINQNLVYTFGHSLEFNRQHLVIGSKNREFISSSVIDGQTVIEGTEYSNSNGNAYLYKLNPTTNKFDKVKEFEHISSAGEVPKIYGSSVTLNDSHVFVGYPAVLNDVIEVDASSSALYYTDSGSLYFSSTASGSMTMSIADSFSGSVFMYDIDHTSTAGNVFYKNGSIVITDETPDVINTFIGEGDVDFKIECNSKFTIFENEYIISVSPGEFNVSQNPTALVNEEIDFDINRDGKFDLEDLDIILRYINKYKLVIPNNGYTDSGLVTEQDLHTNPQDLSDEELIKRKVKDHPDDEAWWNNDVILLESSDVLLLEHAVDETFRDFSNRTEVLNSTYIDRCRELEVAGKLDFNGDGVVDENDANILISYFLGDFVDMVYGNITPTSTRKFSREIMEFIDAFTGKYNQKQIHPNFHNYIESSSYDKSGSYLSPFVTAIGLYDDENHLIAVSKLAKPIKILQNYPISFKVSFDS